MKKISVFCLFILFFSCLFAESLLEAVGNLAIQTLLPVSTETPYELQELSDSALCEAEFRTNISGAEVYLNGTYYGRTNLVVKNLSPSRYRVELKKSGYETKEFIIHLKKGYRSVYRADLKLILGKIRINNLPSNTSVYLDGSLKSTNVIEATPGYHELKIKRFGYTSYTENVYVKAYEYVNVYPEFTPVPFVISDFRISKESINPDYKNRLGRVDFSFEVTANGSALIQVWNAYGQVVWYKEWTSFSTWSQSVRWDGRDSMGNDLSDGVYTVTISSDDNDYYADLTITLDRSTTYSLFAINSKGSGAGNLPAVFANNLNFFAPYFRLGFFQLDNPSKKYIDISGGLLFDFAHHIEFNIGAGACPRLYTEEDAPFLFYTSLKLFDSVEFDSSTKLCYGFLLHWGFLSDDSIFPYGMDTSNGLGLSALVALDFPLLHLGLSSDYIMAPVNGKDFSQGSLWKNGLSLMFKVNKNLSLNTWAALNSSFNSPYRTENFYPFESLDYGAELLFSLGTSLWQGDFRINGNSFLDGKNYVFVEFGLSYLF